LDCFFYGVLTDRDVLAAVIGRRVAACRIRAASLDGFRRVYVQGASYPMLVAAAGRRVDGVLVGGLSASDIERLSAFEGGGYAMAEAWVAVAPRRRLRARVFMPRAAVKPSAREWTPEDWRRRHRAARLQMVRSGRGRV
jgi:hypothetical protein